MFDGVSAILTEMESGRALRGTGMQIEQKQGVLSELVIAVTCRSWGPQGEEMCEHVWVYCMYVLVCVGDSCDGSAAMAVSKLAGHQRYATFEKGKINGSVTMTGCELSPIHAGPNMLQHDGFVSKESVFVLLRYSGSVCLYFRSRHYFISVIRPES